MSGFKARGDDGLFPGNCGRKAAGDTRAAIVGSLVGRGDNMRCVGVSPGDVKTADDRDVFLRLGAGATFLPVAFVLSSNMAAGNDPILSTADVGLLLVDVLDAVALFPRPSFINSDGVAGAISAVDDDDDTGWCCIWLVTLLRDEEMAPAGDCCISCVALGVMTDDPLLVLFDVPGCKWRCADLNSCCCCSIMASFCWSTLSGSCSELSWFRCWSMLLENWWYDTECSAGDVNGEKEADSVVAILRWCVAGTIAGDTKGLRKSCSL